MSLSDIVSVLAFFANIGILFVRSFPAGILQMFADPTFTFDPTAIAAAPQYPPPPPKPLPAERPPVWLCEVLYRDAVYDVFTTTNLASGQPRYVVRRFRTVDYVHRCYHEEPLPPRSVRYRILLDRAADQFPSLFRHRAL